MFPDAPKQNLDSYTFVAWKDQDAQEGGGELGFSKNLSNL